MERSRTGFVEGRASSRGAEAVPVLIVWIIPSVLLFGLMSVFLPTIAAEDDGGRSEFNATLLRQMASRGVKISTTAAYDSNIARAGFASAAEHASLN